MTLLAFVLLSALGGAVLSLTLTALLIFAWPHLTRRHAPEWLCRLRGEPPWAKPDHGSIVDGCGPDAEWIASSRHDPAEASVSCPMCHTEVAAAGDFRNVRRAIIDGEECEVLKCPGIIQDDPSKKPRPCKVFLVASPDTEHGDHLGPDGQPQVTGDIPPEMYRFKRSTAKQILRERYGADITGGSDDAPEISDKDRPAGPAKPDVVDVPLAVAVAMQMGDVGDTDPKYKNLKPKE